MKFSFVLLLLVTSINLYALNVYPVSVTSLYSSTAFRGVENINLPEDGELISNYYFTPDDIFDGGTTYKRIHHIPGSPNWNASNFWPYNAASQIFTLDVIQADADAKWRPMRTDSVGNLIKLGWVNLDTGSNHISMTAQAEDVQIVGFETSGSFKFTKFSHEFGTQSWGYEEILVAIPEPTTYALILGMIAISISLRKNSKRYANLTN